MMSGLEMLELDYERGDGPTSMVLKFPATNEANRAVALAFDIYRREVLFYRDVAALTPAATPEVYFAEIDGKELFVLLLEDMSHYRLGDQIEGCGRCRRRTVHGRARRAARQLLERRRPARARVHPVPPPVAPCRRAPARRGRRVGHDARGVRRRRPGARAGDQGSVPRRHPADAGVDDDPAAHGRAWRLPHGQPVLRDGTRRRSRRRSGLAGLPPREGGRRPRLLPERQRPHRATAAPTSATSSPNGTKPCPRRRLGLLGRAGVGGLPAGDPLCRGRSSS